MTGYNEPKAPGYAEPKTAAYTEPRVVKPAKTGAGKSVWYVAAGVVAILALAWFFGLFSMTDTTPEAPGVGTETIAPAGDAASDPAAAPAPAAPAN